MNEPATLITAGERTQKRDLAVAPSPVDPNANPMQMLAIMTQRGVSMADLKDLVALAKDWEAGQARKAYVEAMALFKAEPHKIFKTKDVKIPNGPQFKHATLADVADGVVASLAKFGLSHNWITEQNADVIKVTCVITHKMGHSERTELVGAPDTGPGRNKIQAVGSTITYLQRYTLMAACGLAASDMDDDGKASGKITIEREPEPNGYADWTLDMEALADEGFARLTAVWAKAKPEYRRYVVKFDEPWWDEQKAKAKKVPVPS